MRDRDGALLGRIGAGEGAASPETWSFSAESAEVVWSAASSRNAAGRGTEAVGRDGQGAEGAGGTGAGLGRGGLACSFSPNMSLT